MTTRNYKWARVVRTEEKEGVVDRRNANESTLKNDVFLKACEAVGTKPTKRQASKWNNKKGAAYLKGRW